MGRLITLAIGVSLMIWLTRQCRKPTGVLGRRMARVMNVTHSSLTDWGLSHVSIGRADRVLDVGCGGGRTIQKLAGMAPDGHISGLDYAAASVDVARQTNADTIAAGRVSVEQGSVAALPFSDGAFDIVTAVETHYYWPDLEHGMREIVRVLRPGGIFVLIAETVKDRQPNPLYRVAMPLLGAHHLTTAEHSDLLQRAGFVDVAVDTRATGWLCVTAKRGPIIQSATAGRS
jgi:ubiquinone/menaquinone biosynthesis C-methylase UbiE